MTLLQKAYAELILGLIGFGIFLDGAGAEAAIGLFIVLFANNINRSGKCKK